MRASKLLTRTHHTYGPDGWQGILTREDAETLGGHLCRGFSHHAPRGSERHSRLVSVLGKAMKLGQVYVAEDEARTLMSAWRLTHASQLETEAGPVPSEATLETGVKVYPERTVKQRLLTAFNRTFPKARFFDIAEVAV